MCNLLVLLFLLLSFHDNAHAQTDPEEGSTEAGATASEAEGSSTTVDDNATSETTATEGNVVAWMK